MDISCNDRSGPCETFYRIITADYCVGGVLVNFDHDRALVEAFSVEKKHDWKINYEFILCNKTV